MPKPVAPSSYPTSTEAELRSSGLPWWKLILVCGSYRARMTQLATEGYRRELQLLTYTPGAISSTEGSVKGGREEMGMAQYVSIEPDTDFTCRHPHAIIQCSTLASLRSTALSKFPPAINEAHRLQQVKEVEEELLRQRRLSLERNGCEGRPHARVKIRVPPVTTPGPRSSSRRISEVDDTDGDTTEVSHLFPPPTRSTRSDTCLANLLPISSPQVGLDRIHGTAAPAMPVSITVVRAGHGRPGNRTGTSGPFEGVDRLYGLSYYWDRPLPPSGFIRLQPDPRWAMWEDDACERDRQALREAAQQQRKALARLVNNRNKRAQRLRQAGWKVGYEQLVAEEKRLMGNGEPHTNHARGGAQQGPRSRLLGRSGGTAPAPLLYDGALNINVIREGRGGPQSIVGTFRQSLWLIHFKVYCRALHEEERLQRVGSMAHVGGGIDPLDPLRTPALTRSGSAKKRTTTSTELLRHVPLIPAPVLRVQSSPPPLLRPGARDAPDLSKVQRAQCWEGLTATPPANRTSSASHVWHYLHRASPGAKRALRGVFQSLPLDAAGRLDKHGYIMFVLDLVHLFFPTHLEEAHLRLAEEEWVYRGTTERVGFETFFEKFFSIPFIFLRDLASVTEEDYIEFWDLVQVCLHDGAASVVPADAHTEQGRESELDAHADRIGRPTDDPCTMSMRRKPSMYARALADAAHTRMVTSTAWPSSDHSDEPVRSTGESCTSGSQAPKGEEGHCSPTAVSEVSHADSLLGSSPPSLRPCGPLAEVPRISGLSSEQVVQISNTDFRHEVNYPLHRARERLLASDEVIQRLPESRQPPVLYTRSHKMVRKNERAEEVHNSLTGTCLSAHATALGNPADGPCVGLSAPPVLGPEGVARAAAWVTSSTAQGANGEIARPYECMEDAICGGGLTAVADLHQTTGDHVYGYRVPPDVLASSQHYRDRHHRSLMSHAKMMAYVGSTCSAWDMYYDDVYRAPVPTDDSEDHLLQFLDGVDDSVFDSSISLRERYLLHEAIRAERRRRYGAAYLGIGEVHPLPLALSATSGECPESLLGMIKEGDSEWWMDEEATSARASSCIPHANGGILTPAPHAFHTGAYASGQSTAHTPKKYISYAAGTFPFAPVFSTLPSRTQSHEQRYLTSPLPGERHASGVEEVGNANRDTRGKSADRKSRACTPQGTPPPRVADRGKEFPSAIQLPVAPRVPEPSLAPGASAVPCSTLAIPPSIQESLAIIDGHGGAQRCHWKELTSARAKKTHAPTQSSSRSPQERVGTPQAAHYALEPKPSRSQSTQYSGMAVSLPTADRDLDLRLSSHRRRATLFAEKQAAAGQRGAYRSTATVSSREEARGKRRGQ